MDIRAAEISAILKEQIKNFGQEAEVSEVGQVLSVGDGKLLPDGERAGHQVSEGDRVLFSAWSGTEVEVDGEELLIMSEEDILAVLD